MNRENIRWNYFVILSLLLLGLQIISHYLGLLTIILSNDEIFKNACELGYNKTLQQLINQGKFLETVHALIFSQVAASIVGLISPLIIFMLKWSSWRLFFLRCSILIPIWIFIGAISDNLNPGFAELYCLGGNTLLFVLLVISVCISILLLWLVYLISTKFKAKVSGSPTE